MRLSAKRVIVVVAAAAVAVGLGQGPAAAATGKITVTSGQYTCAYYASKTSSYVRATDGTAKPRCTDLAATVYYKSAGGKTYAGITEVRSGTATSYVPSGTTYYYGVTAGAPGAGSFVEQTV